VVWRQIAAAVEMHPRTEMLDLIVVDGRARGIVARDLISGKVSTYFADDRVARPAAALSSIAGRARHLNPSGD
jgi:succinate dehydrogenase/fumarate reductase flavoprotein subunit